MARIEVDPNYSSPTFSRATAATDPFKKEDVQALAAAMSTHDHSSGKGLALAAGAIPNGYITSAMIADGTIVAADLGLAANSLNAGVLMDGTVAGGKIQANALQASHVAPNAFSAIMPGFKSSTAVIAKYATPVASVPNTTWTLANFGAADVVVADTGFASSSNAGLTVAFTGTYFLCGYCTYVPSNVATVKYATFAKNNSPAMTYGTMYHFAVPNDASISGEVEFTQVHRLTAGDTIGLSFYHGAGVTLNISSASITIIGLGMFT